MILSCGTSNPGKLREFQLAAPDFEIRSIPAPPPEELGETFEANACSKALDYGSRAGGYVFADDSGLEVEALGGAPGVHSARFAGPEATDRENNELLLERLEKVENRSARFVCVIALVLDGALIKTFRGTVEGRIIDPMSCLDIEEAFDIAIPDEHAGKTLNIALDYIQAKKNQHGFGYDPLFYYEPFGCTFGEASDEQKMQVSHRGNALRAMFDFLRSQ